MKNVWIGMFVLFVLLGGACSLSGKDESVSILESENGNTLTVCEYSKIKKDEKQMNLSELVDVFKIVYLDNDDNAFFKFSSLAISENYIGIIQQNGPFLLFNHNGDYLCNVGNMGAGPGEYARRPYDAIIDEENQKIYLATFAFSNKILVYDLSGNFINEITTEQQLSKPKISLDEDEGLSIVHLPLKMGKTDPVLAIYLNEKGEQQNYPAEEKFLVTDFNQDLFAEHNTPDFSFYNTINDTLYHYVAEKNRIYPKFTIDFGLLDPKPIHIYNETNRFYMANIFDKGLVFVDKEEHWAAYIRVVNDYCGHMKYPQYSFKNGWAFRMFEPHQLIKWIEKRLEDEDCSVDDRAELEKLLSSIDEEGNNVLFMGKLK